VGQDNSINFSKFNGNKPTSETIECLASTAEILRPKKRTKVEELSTITLAYMKNKRPDQADQKQKLRVLFDSGCGTTLINKRFVSHWKKTESKSTKWSTKGGSFKTKRRCAIEFTLPAFHENRKITCSAYVDESHHESSNYDMIIGRDLLHSQGINLLFDTAEILWDNAKIHMQPPGRTNGDWLDTMEQELLYAHDPNTTDAERIQSIIASKYCPADLNKIVEECTHLGKTEQRQLLKLLQFEDLFDGTLGTWKTDPVDLEFTDPKVNHFMPNHTLCHTLKRKD
jgi:hypothetical protein